jgi:hypothetical protein
VGTLAPHRARVRHVFHGHLHRPIAGSWRGLPISSLRGTAFAVTLGQRPGEAAVSRREAPCYALARVLGDDVAVHTVELAGRRPAARRPELPRRRRPRHAGPGTPRAHTRRKHVANHAPDGAAPVRAGPGGRRRAALAQAPAWRPASQVRIVVPAAPGGTTDIMGRLCAQHLQARWGVPVAVENRSGAGGTIGTLEVGARAPNGLTLLSGNIGPQAIAYSLFRNLPYREDQVAPVSGQIRGPNVLVVNAATPVRTMQEFVAWLRKDGGGRVTYASTGVGQSTHLSPVWMLQLLNAQASTCRSAAPRRRRRSCCRTTWASWWTT